MNSLYQLMLTTGCNLIQWVLDNNPAPANDARIIAATNSLAAGRQALADAVSNQAGK